MLLKGNNIVYVLIAIYIITLLVPIILFFKSSITFCYFLEYIKDFSLPLWVLLFSCSWLYYKLIINKNVHLRILINQPIAENQANAIVEAIQARNKLIESKITKLDNAEIAIKNIEIAIAVVGIITGVIGLVFFVCK